LHGDEARGVVGRRRLGLAICTEAVNAHEGRVWIKGHRPHETTVHASMMPFAALAKVSLPSDMGLGDLAA
jgi:signal transduction histidine kinase